MTTFFTDAKIQIEEVPPMNGWPKLKLLYKKVTVTFGLGAVTFLLLYFGCLPKSAKPTGLHFFASL